MKPHKCSIGYVASIVIVGGFTLASLAGTAHADLTLQSFSKQCAEKMIVMGYDDAKRPIQVGEKIDSYCEGVLEGTFAVLTRKQVICPKEAPTTDFLLSLILTYQRDAKPTSKDISEIIEAAFIRGFSCQ